MSTPSQVEAAAPVAPRSRRKIIAIGIAFVLILVAIAAAAVYYLTLPPGFSGTIKIGFTISQTGNFNVEGTNSLNGIKTAANWLNSHGGIAVGGKLYNVSLDYYDDQSMQGNIGTLYPRIIQQDGAQFLLAPYSSLLTAPAAPIADQYDRVMLSHGGSSDLIWTQTSRRNLVEVLSSASIYLKGAVDWLKANHPTDKIAALYASDSFSSFATQAALGYAQSLGLTVVYNQSYPLTVTDLSTQLTAAKNAGADDLIGGGHFNDGLLIMNDLKTAWTMPAPKFISLLVAVTEPTFQTQLTNYANYVTGPSQWETVVSYSPSLAQSLSLPWYGPTPAEFTQLYGTLNGGATPGYHAGEAGAALFVLADAIQRANSLNTTDVRAKLGTMHVMNFFGQFQLDSRGLQIAHSMVLVQWQGGVKKVVLPSDVADGTCQYPYTGT
ncbi:MAG: branched-chain amino acid ABC transporter substrate-binding protein [Bacillati bacterium ANGP1]|uniref:Branched-chain amino acid ABC transporter substrate-binding protein n=1 Tax=Candidatus Segetimicrobium genomatis TaxID=2569760 RepID=A0A537L7M8_9BACT|nr:MAG: branched-chain amino acid ABC transporter substrate-binding protein [Terrabacteria group bacterium ANGP1]